MPAMGLLQRFVLLCSLFGLMIQTGISHAQLNSETAGQNPNPAQTTTQGEFVNRIFQDAKGDHKYVVYVPANYDPGKKWPVILFLHGACNRGTDGRSQLVSGLAPAIRLQLSTYPFLVVFPQCENIESRLLGGWTDQPDDADRALKILDTVEKDYSVDTRRECLVGLSMGGTGAWEIAARTPERWAALVPVSAMAKQADVPKVSQIPTWVFHATQDPLVATHVARDMVVAMNEAGGRAYFTEVTKRAHDLSNLVFTQPALTDWLLDPSQPPNQNLTWTEPEGYRDGHELEVPFVPGAEIQKAVRMRVCKDVLEAFCIAAPKKLATKPLGGYVGTVQQSKKVGGILPIEVALNGVQYNGSVEQVRVIPKAPDRLIVQLALRNLTMSVSNSKLNGKLLLSAKTGPMNIVIGQAAPVWLTVELRPTVQDRRVTLNLVGTDFRIPDNNWHVTEPSNVQVRGLPFLNAKVSDGIVEGIYGRKNEIERQVLTSISTLVQKMESQLNEVVFSKTTSLGQIAMPIWQPRMKTFPQELTIDDDGITLVSGITLCALGHVPDDFKVRKYAALDKFPPLAKTGLQIDVAETVVPAWSELIVSGRVNRFNVFDFTPEEYHRLASRDFLQSVIPDLQRFGDELETNVDFRLRNPIRLRETESANDPTVVRELPGNPLTLSLSSVPLFVSMRKKGETQWTPVGELDLHIDRDYAPSVRKTGFARRGTKFVEASSFRIKSKWTFAPEYIPENRDVNEPEIVAAVLKAREAAQLMEGVKPDSTPDFVMNDVPLRMNDLNWVNQHIVIQLQLPGVRLSNNSTEPLVYEIRGQNTDWSPVQTLAPGDSVIHPATSDVTWRRRSQTDTMTYTLPMGKEFSFRNQTKPELVTIRQTAELEESTIVPR